MKLNRRNLLALAGLGLLPSVPWQAFAQDLTSEEVLKRVLAIHEKRSGESLRDRLSMTQVFEVFRRTIENRVSRLDVLSQYDPDGFIGFCFGRALSAQLTSRTVASLDPAGIYKLFIIGDLRSNPAKEEWRFHVTTVVPGKASNGRDIWVALDPIMDRPLLVADWIKNVRGGWDSWHGGAPRAHLYLAPGLAIMPDIRDFPVPESGKHIIELNFDPDAKGILPSDAWMKQIGTRDKVRALSQDQSEKLFLTAKPGLATSFDFLSIKINEDLISYKNYFVDLLGTFGPEIRTLLAMNTRAAAPRAKAGPALGFQLHKLRAAKGN